MRVLRAEKHPLNSSFDAFHSKARSRPHGITGRNGHAPSRSVVLTAFAVSIRAHPSASQVLFSELWDQHVATEFVTKSADEAVATMVPHARVNHVPTQTGGSGTEALREFYAHHFIPKMPDDVKITPINRVVGESALVDEFIFEFTHSVEMDWMLPGVAPTNCRVAVPFVVSIEFEGNKLSSERIYWDQASVLVQLGLLDAALLPGHPVSGVEQAQKLIDFDAVSSNATIPQQHS